MDSSRFRANDDASASSAAQDEITTDMILARIMLARSQMLGRRLYSAWLRATHEELMAHGRWQKAKPKEFGCSLAISYMVSAIRISYRPSATRSTWLPPYPDRRVRTYSRLGHGPAALRRRRTSLRRSRRRDHRSVPERGPRQLSRLDRSDSTPSELYWRVCAENRRPCSDNLCSRRKTIFPLPSRS